MYNKTKTISQSAFVIKNVTIYEHKAQLGQTDSLKRTLKEKKTYNNKGLTVIKEGLGLSGMVVSKYFYTKFNDISIIEMQDTKGQLLMEWGYQYEDFNGKRLLTEESHRVGGDFSVCTTYEYDAKGWCTQKSVLTEGRAYPSNTTYTYNKAGKKTTARTTMNGQFQKCIKYVYDHRGRVKEEQFVDEQHTLLYSHMFAYTALDSLETKIVIDAKRMQQKRSLHVYTAQKRLKTKTIQEENIAGNWQKLQTITYTYNDKDLVTSQLFYNAQDKLLSELSYDYVYWE